MPCSTERKDTLLGIPRERIVHFQGLVMPWE